MRGLSAEEPQSHPGEILRHGEIWEPFVHAFGGDFARAIMVRRDGQIPERHGCELCEDRAQSRALICTVMAWLGAWMNGERLKAPEGERRSLFIA